MPLDTTWQIIPPGSTAPVPAASLGVNELTRSRRNLAPDTVTMSLDGRNTDAAALFAYGQTATILRGNVQWFVGRVTQTPASGNSDARTSGAPSGNNAVGLGQNHPVQTAFPLTVPGTAPTPLSPYMIDGTHVGVTYGTICGAQPSGFAAGGTPPFKLAVSGTGYLYATATYDFTNLIWTNPMVVSNTNASMANTSTVAYALIGSYAPGTAANTLTVVSAETGDVSFDPSQLADDNGS